MYVGKRESLSKRKGEGEKKGWRRLELKADSDADADMQP